MLRQIIVGDKSYQGRNKLSKTTSGYEKMMTSDDERRRRERMTSDDERRQ